MLARETVAEPEAEVAAETATVTDQATADLDELGKNKRQ